MTSPVTSTNKYDKYLNKTIIKDKLFYTNRCRLSHLGFVYTGFSFSDLMVGVPQIGDFFKQMFPPEWSYLKAIWQPMLDTIRMAIVGTF